MTVAADADDVRALGQAPGRKEASVIPTDVGICRGSMNNDGFQPSPEGQLQVFLPAKGLPQHFSPAAPVISLRTFRNRASMRFVTFPTDLRRQVAMKLLRDRLAKQEGKAGWILLWLLGVPIPVLFVLFLLRGCT
jgi:hypothetical protein